MGEVDSSSVFTPERLKKPSEYGYKDEATKPLSSLANITSLLLVIYALICLVRAAMTGYRFYDDSFISNGAQYPVSLDIGNPKNFHAIAMWSGPLLERVFFFGCAFFVSWFTHRSIRNLYSARSTTPEMPPLGAVVRYYVPIASMVLPYAALTQIYEGSVEETGRLANSGIVIFWLGAWIVDHLGFAVWFFTSSEGSVGKIGAIVSFVAASFSALLLRTIILRISIAQHASIIPRF